MSNGSDARVLFNERQRRVATLVVSAPPPPLLSPAAGRAPGVRGVSQTLLIADPDPRGQAPGGGGTQLPPPLQTALSDLDP